MSGFSVAWLNLREAADKRARDAQLREQALAWLGLATAATPFPNPSSTGASFTNTPLSLSESIVVDLGAGTGSTLRALAAPGSQQLVWRLVEHDGNLLDDAIRRHGKQYRIEDYQADLSVVNELPLGGARLVTASALFDLVSAPVVDALVKRLASMRTGWSTGLYAALNYDGTTTWEPPHPDDAAMLTAFNHDQRRDKGMGPALGPDATRYLQHALEAAGFTVQIAASPWQLGPDDAAMVAELIDGIASAVVQSGGMSSEKVEAWREFRLAQVAQGSCWVGHLDLLALG
jgi:hypothetical protein